MSWFTDLTLADPYYALPIMSSAVFLLTVELGAADGMQGQDEALLRRMKNIFRAMGVAMIPLTASFPQVKPGWSLHVSKQPSHFCCVKAPQSI